MPLLTSRRNTTVYTTEDGARVHGLIAEYDTPADVAHAAEKVRDLGYTRWDVFSPFPIHEIDEYMGVKWLSLPLIVGVAGISGAIVGFSFQYLVTDVLYQMVVQGKPYHAWEPWIPVTFEFGVIGTAFSALLGMLAFNGLPRYHHPLLKHDRFLKVGDDRFFICIEATDEKFDPEGARTLLESTGGSHITLVEE